MQYNETKKGRRLGEREKSLRDEATHLLCSQWGRRAPLPQMRGGRGGANCARSVGGYKHCVCRSDWIPASGNTTRAVYTNTDFTIGNNKGKKKRASKNNGTMTMQQIPAPSLICRRSKVKKKKRTRSQHPLRQTKTLCFTRPPPRCFFFFFHHRLLHQHLYYSTSTHCQPKTSIHLPG